MKLMNETNIIKSIDTLSKKIEKLTHFSIAMHEKIDTLVTKEHVVQLQDRLVTQLDQHTVILQRLDQERVFTLDRVRELEGSVEKIKLQLHIA